MLHCSPRDCDVDPVDPFIPDHWDPLVTQTCLLDSVVHSAMLIVCESMCTYIHHLTNFTLSLVTHHCVLTPQCPEQKQECKREMGAECVFVLCMTEGWSSCEYWMTCIAFLVLPVLIDLLSGSELDGRRIDVKYDKFA